MADMHARQVREWRATSKSFIFKAVHHIYTERLTNHPQVRYLPSGRNQIIRKADETAERRPCKCSPQLHAGQAKMHPKTLL